MKTKNIHLIIWAILGITLFTSCENEDISFSDFDYQTVYFANQYYVRTIELGEDLFVDTSNDNLHKFMIKATMGGVYENKKDRTINLKIDESLCSSLYFATGEPITVMPSAYYKLASNQITIPSGSILGGVEVQLTDAFFEDEKSLETTYVIPLVMTDVASPDSILRGKPTIGLDNPNRVIDANWTIKPRDFVLCAVKYINRWQANYLRRGVDQIVSIDGAKTSVRHASFVENNEVVSTKTNSLTRTTLPLTIKDADGHAINFKLLLDFNNDGACTVSGNTDAYEITGSGKFVSKGEKNSIGGYDRDALYLDYSVKFKEINTEYTTKDTLVVRDRGVAPEYFTVIKK